MTALELVLTVEARGGTLALRGDKIRCSVPEDATHLLEAVRAQRDAVIEVLRERDASGLPWPGYNNGKQFCCVHCGTRFDTSAGSARHQVKGCDQQDSPPPSESARPLPSCPSCGSYALYREKSGVIICETCRRSS